MNARSLFRRHCLLLLVAVCTLAGCGSHKAPPLKLQEGAEFDKEVETTWKQNWAWVEGRQFLEKGGNYQDSGAPGDPPYDKPHILPLMQRLTSKHGMKWHAVVDKKKRNLAVALVGEYPDRDGIQKAVMDDLEEEQKTFPLDILVVPGNHWLKLDFLTSEDAKFLSDAPPPAK
jgi:hypothetical protein